MGQAQHKRRAVLIVEDDTELRSLTAALLEDKQLDTIECESAEAALATLLIGGREMSGFAASWTALIWRARSRCAGRFFPSSSLREIRGSASVNSRPASLTCPSRGSRSTC